MSVRRLLRAVVVVLAALAVVVALLLPPRPRATLASADDALASRATLRGAYHIHTNRSDGTGSVDEVAAAAARAGLQFIIFTDHGDGMRAPLAPSVRSGVLCLDGVEISTTGGHYVALGLPATPYRLAGEPRDVVSDVRRLGGFGIAAHPDSPKAELRWSGWDTGIDGLEWLNTDTEWRDESRASLLRALTTYPWRPAETLARLVSRERTLLTRWDDLARTRRIVGVAGVDAHARIGLRDGPDPYGGRVLLKVPSYEASFGTFTLHVELDAPLSGDTAGDAARNGAALLAAIRAGRVYTTLDALAPSGIVGFEATTAAGVADDAATASPPDAAAALGQSAGVRRARMGDFLVPAGAVEWRAAAAAPAGATLRLVCDGRLAAEAPATTRLTHRQEAGQAPSACRLEAGWDDDDDGRRVTWLVTNPIYLRATDSPLPADSTSPDAAPPVVERLPGDFGGSKAWTIERDPQSAASWAWTAGIAGALEFTYRLRAGGRVNQYVAFVTQQVASVARATRVSFRASADKPMRVSVQVRRPLDRPGDGERWQRSVYVDPTPRDIAVRFDDMRPVSPTRDAHPPLDRIHALLFVVDAVHTPPGASGTFRIEDLRFER